jgi:uncharacterized NAD(P)/FAD-binding protein YdhS
MVGKRAPRVRIVGGGDRLRLRTLGDWESDPIGALGECRRAATALEKAMTQTVAAAREAGQSWTAIGDALGVTKQTAWERFSDGMRHPITGEKIDRPESSDS